MGIKDIRRTRGLLPVAGLAALAMLVAGGAAAVSRLPGAEQPAPASATRSATSAASSDNPVAPANPAAGPARGAGATVAVAPGVSADVAVARADAVASPAPPRPAVTGQPAVLLWPFTSRQQVLDWEAANREGGHQPWHGDPCETTRSFVQFVLGFADVTGIASCRTTGDQSWVVPGYQDGSRVIPTAATIHLVRVGHRPGSWVVVGSRDVPQLTLTSPRYGATVGSTVHLAGQVHGLGEDVLKVRVLDSFGEQLGAAPDRLVGLGGDWSTDIRLPAGPQHVLIAVASVDSGLGSLGNLAITALRR